MKRADAKKKGTTQLKKAAKQTKRTVGVAKAAATKAARAVDGFRGAVKVSNQEAFQQRQAVAPRPSGPGTETRVLQSMLAPARA